MIISKSQIRPRQIRVRMTNADILMWDTLGTITLVAPPGNGDIISLEYVAMFASIIADYTNIDAGAEMGFYGGFTSLMPWFGWVGITPAIDYLLTQGGNPVATERSNAYSQSGVLSNILTPATAEGTPQFGYGTGPGGLSNFFSLDFFFTNNGAGDLTGGDPANFVDFLIRYSLMQQ